MTKRITADHVKLKRAYEPAAADDGTRILIDRLWPRGDQESRRRDRSMGQGYRAQHGVTKMVRSRSGALGGVSPPVRGGGPPASRTAQQITGPGKTRSDHARVLGSRRGP